MSFRYNKVSRAEADKPREYPLLEPGIYQFDIDQADYKLSSKGNDMIVVKLSVWNTDKTKQFTVFDYLVATDQMSWKVRHLADAVNLSKEYENDSFNEHMLPGRGGLVDIGVQAAKPNPNGGTYASKNVVLDYVMTETGQVKSDLKPFKDDAVPKFEENDLPF